MAALPAAAARIRAAGPSELPAALHELRSGAVHVGLPALAVGLAALEQRAERGEAPAPEEVEAVLALTAGTAEDLTPMVVRIRGGARGLSGSRTPARLARGEVAERSNAAVSKTVRRFRPQGSNPSLSVPLPPVPVTGGHDGTAGQPVDGPRRQDDGGISTRLMEWTMPLLARGPPSGPSALLT